MSGLRGMFSCSFRGRWDPGCQDLERCFRVGSEGGVRTESDAVVSWQGAGFGVSGPR